MLVLHKDMDLREVTQLHIIKEAGIQIMPIDTRVRRVHRGHLMAHQEDNIPHMAHLHKIIPIRSIQDILPNKDIPLRVLLSRHNNNSRSHNNSHRSNNNSRRRNNSHNHSNLSHRLNKTLLLQTLLPMLHLLFLR